MKLGADVVLHSATKYLNGHSDALCGVVLTDNEALKNKLVWMQEGTSVAVYIGVV
jgi:cystathionine beta-lyase/cystathionine gamma-synthase